MVAPTIFENPVATLIVAAVKDLGVGVNKPTELIKESKSVLVSLFVSEPPYPETVAVVEGFVIPGIVKVTNENAGPEISRVICFKVPSPIQEFIVKGGAVQPVIAPLGIMG